MHSRRFLDATGRLPQKREVFGPTKVGGWLVLQRREAKSGLLSKERVQMIEDALGVDALASVTDLEFERQLNNVFEHRRLHGKLPSSHGDAHILGMWMSHARAQANRGSLSAAHTQRLDTVLGAEWRSEFKNTMVRLPSHHSVWLPAAKYTPCCRCP